MIQTPATTLEPAGGKLSSAGSSSTLLFWMIVAVPVAALVLAFPLVRSSVFKRYFDYELLSVQTSLHEAKNRNCDILLFGDSTAETGLDPAIVSAETGLSACNIATTRPTFEILGQEPLDHYLARNPKPRFLVMQYSSGNLHEFLDKQMDPDHMDGVILTIRYYEWTRAAEVMVRFPDYVIGLLNYTYLQGGKRMISLLAGRHQAPKIQDNDDYFAWKKPPLTHCVQISSQAVTPDPSYVMALRRRYSPYADHVIINASPTSPCNDRYPEWKSLLNGVTDRGPELLPNNLFIDEFYHLSQAGTERNSKAVAQQILALEEQTSKPASLSKSRSEGLFGKSPEQPVQR